MGQNPEKEQASDDCRPDDCAPVACEPKVGTPDGDTADLSDLQAALAALPIDQALDAVIAHLEGDCIEFPDVDPGQVDSYDMFGA